MIKFEYIKRRCIYSRKRKYSSIITSLLHTTYNDIKILEEKCLRKYYQQYYKQLQSLERYRTYLQKPKNRNFTPILYLQAPVKKEPLLLIRIMFVSTEALQQTERFQLQRRTSM